MRRKEVGTSMWVAAVVMLTTLPALGTNDLSLNVDPATECVSTSDTITVTLDVEALSCAINGVQVLLHYDPTVMTLVDIVPTDLGFTSPDQGWVEVDETDNAGDVNWAAVINGNSTSFPHTIATATFIAVADGTANVSFRADAAPLLTKLTCASGSTTLLPTKWNTNDDFDGDGVGDAFVGPPDCTITADSSVCDGTSGHSASVPNAGAGATYAWSVTGGTLDSGQGTDTISYTATDPSSVTIDVTVTDANGCSSSCQQIVPVNANPDCTITAADSVCALTTGHVASVPTAVATATYNWSISGGTITSGQGTESITFDAGSGPTIQLDITIVDGNGCTSTCQKIISVSAPDCTITAEDAVCDGTSGHVASVPDAGAGATYAWTVTGGTIDSGAGTSSISYTATDPASVTIDVTVTQAGGCSSDCQKIVTVNANPVADAGADVTLCADAGAPTVGGVPTASGGLGPYTYAWSGSGSGFLSSTTAANPTFDVATAGPGVYDVCVIVTDANLCDSVQDCAVITINALPVANAGSDITACEDAPDPVVGATTVATGGLAPYTYAWTGTGAAFLSSTTVANPTFDVVTAGPGVYDVCVVVTDANLCDSVQDCAVITINALPLANAGTDATICEDAPDPVVGAASTATGGLAPYTYSWTGTGAAFLSSTSAANPTFDVATAGPGVYDACVVVTDANLCSSIQDCAVITINAVPVANAGSDVTICEDAPDPVVGAVSTATGGLAPYTYSWTGTGAAFLSSTIVANPSFDVVTAGPGVYDVCVVVTDANLCSSVQDCAVITINALPVADAGADFALCANAPDPTVGGAPTASGGLGPYTYAWSGTGAAFLSSLTAANPTFDVATAGVGTYDVCVTVTDANLCVSTTDCATITVNLVLDCTITTTDPVCAGTSHLASVANAGAGATYDWTVTGGTQDTPDDFDNITYTAGAGPSVTIDITVTDINSCTNTCQSVVTVNDNPTANAGTDVTVCDGDPDPVVGAATVATGGTAPYTYLWTGTGAVYLSDTGIANPSFDVLTAGPGSYDVCVTVTDANSCVSSTDCAIVTVNDLPLADAGADVVVCADAADPSVGGASTGSGGLGPYTYLWSGSGSGFLSSTTAANPTFDVVLAGVGVFDVCVTVTDSNGCVSATDCAVVTVNELPVANAGSDIAVCADAADPIVGATTTATGGLAPYTYAWSGTAAPFLSDTLIANPTFDVAGAGPGSYQACVTVTDANGCVSLTDCATITVNALPGCTITAPSLVCEGSTGHAASAPAGAVTYAWSLIGDGTIDSGQGTDSITFSAGLAGTITLEVTVTDANGCVSTCQQDVTVDAPNCTITTPDSVCFQSTGNLATAPSGAVSYVWNITGGTITSQTDNAITYSAGTGTDVTLEVTVTNSNGCTRTCQKVVAIQQPRLDATIQLEAIGSAVTRDVTFVFTECGGTTDTRVVPVTTDVLGIGSVTVDAISPNADWVAVQEGHTLRRLEAVTFGSCFVASIDLTSAGTGRSLPAGDLHTATVTQDNLCDIVDFSILASRWNNPISANASDGADVTGDGFQDSADFTAIQVNYFNLGEGVDGCGVPSSSGSTDEIVRLDPTPIAPDGRQFRSSVPVDSLGIENGSSADLNSDGVVDASDIVQFARDHNLRLLPEFKAKLTKIERASRHKGQRR